MELRMGIAVAALAAAACSGEDRRQPPRWSSLAAAPGTHLGERGDGPDFEFAVPAESWRPAGLPGYWRSAVHPFVGTDLPRDLGDRLRVAAAGRELARLDPTLLTSGRDAPSGSFHLGRAELFLLLEPSERPPEVVVSVPATLSTVRAGRSRVLVRGTTGDGFSLRTGETVELRVEVPPRSVLRFDAIALNPIAVGEVAPGRLVVEVDGRPVGEVDAVAGRTAEFERHEVALPPTGGTSATFRFRADGADALWAVLAPVVGPAQIGSYAGRSRKNVVVFLADTLRADALSAYGGTLELTPRIDELAAEAVVFERTWSPSSWTLPAHASLFTATHPHQHGARSSESRLGEGLETLAERLRDAGYRTGAVTDGLFVSRTFGLDRGFEWFREFSDGDPEKTTAALRRFLDAHDGRPFFLFVQSYRVHRPFAASPEVLAAHGARLGIDATWDELVDALHREVVATYGESERTRDPEGAFAFLSGPWTDGMREIVDRLRRLYHGGVLDLDAAFGEWMAELDARGLRDSTYVVFTSDHGEGFGEHGAVFHRNGVWDEVSRVPLLIRGPALAPRRSARTASLVDLPRTLTGLVGVDAAPRWLGADLFGSEEERPIYYFDCAWSDAQVAWVDARYKVAFDTEGDADVRGQPVLVYDLAGDPAESENLAGDLPAEVHRTLSERVAELRALMVPLDEREAVSLDEGTLRRLEAMGYKDGE